MKKILILLLLLTAACLSAQVDVKITNVKVNGSSIGSTAPIQFGSQSSIGLSFTVEITKPQVLDVGGVDISAGIVNNSFSRKYSVKSANLPASSGSSNETYSVNFSGTVYASDINYSPNCYLVVFVQQTDLDSESLEWESDHRQMLKYPVYSLTASSQTIPCGSTAPITFTVNSAAPSGATTYSWTRGSNWSGSTTPTGNTISFTPSASATTFGPVTVTPTIYGVQQPTLTITLTRAPFTTTAVINGPTTFCSTGTYSITGLEPGVTFDGWIVSNSTIATASSLTLPNTTLTKVYDGQIQLTAKLVNICGQTKSIPLTITIGTPYASIIGPYCPTTSAPCFIDSAANNGYLMWTLTAVTGTYLPVETDWQWEKLSGNFFFNSGGVYNASSYTGKTANIYLTGSNPDNNPLRFRVRVRNACGWGPWREYQWGDGTTTPTTPPPGPPEKYYVLSPNPATYAFSINLLNSGIAPAGNNFPVQLVNPPTGTVVKTGTIVNNYCSIYTGDVASGTYYVKITCGSHVEYHTLVRM